MSNCHERLRAYSISVARRLEVAGKVQTNRPFATAKAAASDGQLWGMAHNQSLALMAGHRVVRIWSKHG